MKKKFLALIACGLASFTMVGCETGEKKAPVANVTVWTASGTEKILRDTDYTSRHANNVLTIKAFREEHESAQIVLTPDGDVKNYTVAAADLKNATGDVLSKDAFTLYNQKYVEVTTLKDLNVTTGTGYYPDALLPFETAVSAGENTVAKGQNQGVWVTVNPKETQAAGVYTGSFTVTADGKNYQVPVSVTVYDYTLDELVHSKSSFAVEWVRMSEGEMDSTVKMQETYYEFLLDYRITPQNLPGNTFHNVTLSGEKLEEWLAYAHKYTLDPRCTSYNLPFECHGTTITLKDGTTKAVTVPYFDQLEQLLRDMADYSFEHKVNLFKKAMTYFIIYDEYDGNGTVHGANYTLTKTYELYDEIAEDLDQKIVCDDAEFKAEVIHDLANLKDKLVGNITEELDVPAAQMVPEVMYIHTPEARQKYYDFAVKSYGEDWELWTYTCCFPLNPYPTYHTEDALLSSRLLSWMMYKYNITGNLYWTTTLNAWRDKANPNTDLQLQDYYDTALRFPSANGDGLLMYPGRPYGIYGPVPTIRLSSIRDGQEDYDLMYALEQYYLERGLTGENFDGVMKLLDEALISGTTVRHGDTLVDTFARSRAELASLLVGAANTGTIVENVAIKDGNAEITVSAPETTVLKQNGQTLTGVTADGITKYSISVPMTGEGNYLSLTATSGDKTADIDLRLGGRVSMLAPSELLSKVKFETGGSAAVETIDGVNALALSYNSTVGTDFETLEAVSATFNVSGFNITNKVNTITINVYSYSDAPVDLRLLGKSGSGVYDEAAKVTLKQGWNEVTLSAAAFNIKEKLDNLRFYITGTAEQKIALGTITIAG